LTKEELINRKKALGEANEEYLKLEKEVEEMKGQIPEKPHKNLISDLGHLRSIHEGLKASVAQVGCVDFDEKLRAFKSLASQIRKNIVRLKKKYIK